MTIWGKTRIIHKIAGKLCGLLDKLKEVGDIAVNVDPLHAGLPWAFIRPLIQVRTSGRAACRQSLYHSHSPPVVLMIL